MDRMPQDYVPPTRRDSWNEYQNLVLDSLERLETRMTALENQQVLTRIDVAMLKVKAGVWGGLAGFIPGALTIAALLLGVGGTG